MVTELNWLLEMTEYCHHLSLVLSPRKCICSLWTPHIWLSTSLYVVRCFSQPSSWTSVHHKGRYCVTLNALCFLCRCIIKSAATYLSYYYLFIYLLFIYSLCARNPYYLMIIIDICDSHSVLPGTVYWPIAIVDISKVGITILISWRQIPSWFFVKTCGPYCWMHYPASFPHNSSQRHPNELEKCCDLCPLL